MFVPQRALQDSTLGAGWLTHSKSLLQAAPGLGCRGQLQRCVPRLAPRFEGAWDIAGASGFGGCSPIRQPACSSSGFFIVLVLLSGTLCNPTAMACTQCRKKNNAEIPLCQFISNV